MCRRRLLPRRPIGLIGTLDTSKGVRQRTGLVRLRRPGESPQIIRVLAALAFGIIAKNAVQLGTGGREALSSIIRLGVAKILDRGGRKFGAAGHGAKKSDQAYIPHPNHSHYAAPMQGRGNKMPFYQSVSAYTMHARLDIATHAFFLAARVAIAVRLAEIGRKNPIYGRLPSSTELSEGWKHG